MAQTLFDGLDNDPPPPSYKFLPNTENMAAPKNVILFGETGAGKSAVINLIAGTEVASTSGGMQACTLQATKYHLTLAGTPSDPAMPVNIWDTVGLEEPDGDTLKAIKNAHTLITDLRAAGGVDLLLFCIRAGRITVAMQRHYRLFFEIMCAKRVPLAMVVTHLENEEPMEQWWVRNWGVLEKYGINSVAHACITAAPKDLQMYASKRASSRTVLENMLRGTLGTFRPAYVQDVQGWLETVLVFLAEWIPLVRLLKRKALAKQLEQRCTFRKEEAQRIADMMLAQR